MQDLTQVAGGQNPAIDPRRAGGIGILPADAEGTPGMQTTRAEPGHLETPATAPPQNSTSVQVARPWQSLATGAISADWGIHLSGVGLPGPQDLVERRRARPPDVVVTPVNCIRQSADIAYGPVTSGIHAARLALQGMS